MAPDLKKLEKLRGERTLVIIKPDGVLRKIVGEVISRFERKGIKIVGMKMVWSTEELAGQHYDGSDSWLNDTGNRAYNGIIERGETTTLTPKEIATEIRNKLMGYLTAGPVVVLVLEGPHVIEVVRRMRGSTSPLKADVGSLGFDYTLESYELSDAGGWAIKNIIHASDAPETAEREIAVWFTKEEVFSYESPMDKLFFSTDWFLKRG